MATGFSDASFEKEVMDIGIQKYFLKPLDLNLLNQTIIELLLPKN